MQKYIIYFFLSLALSLQAAYSSEKTTSLTILAPQNMSYAIAEVMRNYAKENNIALTGSFNPINNLVENIIDGDSADIIITDHPDWIKNLKQKGLISVTSISNLVEDKLVLIANKAFYSINLDNFNNLNSSKDKHKFYKNFTIFIPNWTEDMAGIYAHEALSNLPYLFNNSNNIIETANTLKEISKINDALAITRYTDSYDNASVNIIETFDRNLHQRFIYQIAAIAGENMKQAEGFIKYIKSEAALNVLKKYGFETIE